MGNLALVFLSITSFLLGCATPAYQPPELNDIQLENAASDIASIELTEGRARSLTEATALFQGVKQDLYPSAMFICSQVGKRPLAECGWNFSIVEKDEFNAYASGIRNITFYTKLIDTVSEKEELSFVLAHEIAHHIAGHYQSTVKNINRGAAIGSLIGIALAASEESDDEKLDILNESVNYGASLGSLLFSVKQEQEADLLALEILRHAETDLTKARLVLVRMSQISKNPSLRSSFFDTHPTSFERLAAFDFAHKKKPLFTNSQQVTNRAMSTDQNGVFETVVGSYCIYRVNDRKEAVPKSSGCPKHMNFPK